MAYRAPKRIEESLTSMSDDGKDQSLGRFGPPPGAHAMPSDMVMRVMSQAAKEVMAVQDVTTGDVRQPLRIRGKLTMASDEAFKRLRPQFESVGHTPMLRHEEGLDVIQALPVVFGKERSGPPRLAIIMLISLSFSGAIYGFLSSELDRVENLQRLRVERGIPGQLIPPPTDFDQNPPRLFRLDPDIIA